MICRCYRLYQYEEDDRPCNIIEISLKCLCIHQQKSKTLSLRLCERRCITETSVEAAVAKPLVIVKLPLSTTTTKAVDWQQIVTTS